MLPIFAKKKKAALLAADREYFIHLRMQIFVADIDIN
ncbi:hypothetical protein B14911_13502 [Bacillus sp. NRRL B-14911]|nr:hypothetical protein B14911_13502 [Bacillus sp. NRRL B-14911]